VVEDVDGRSEGEDEDAIVRVTQPIFHNKWPHCTIFS